MGLFGTKSLVYKNEDIGFLKKSWIKITYNSLAYLLNKNNINVQFLNMGYTGNSDLEVKKEDQASQYQIQLYHHITKEARIANKDVLEVGSGIGGGSYYLLKYRKPKQLTAIDLSIENVKLSKKRYSSTYSNVEYLNANACTFDLPTESRDVVINLESSHCYPDMDAFLHRVYKVLRKEGLFCFADIRHSNTVSKLEEALGNSGLTILKKEDISANVLKALSLDHERKKKLLAENWILRHFAGNSFALRDTDQYNALKDGSYVFLHYLCKK